MTKHELRKVLVILPKKDLEKIENEIAEGRYVTKSDFFRLAVKRLLYNDDRIREFERVRVELQKDLKKKRISKSKILKDLGEVKAETAGKVTEMLS